MQVSSHGLSEQEVVTNDSVSLKIVAVVYYKVVNATKTYNVQDENDAIQQLAQSIMRKVIGQHTLDEVLGHSQSMIDAIATELERDVTEWGLDIVRIELKDIVLPEGMRRAMASQAEAQREATAKITAAQGELDSARLLRLAADEMSPVSLELRRLQTYREIGTDNAAIIVVTGQDSSAGNQAAAAAAGQLAAQRVSTPLPAP